VISAGVLEGAITSTAKSGAPWKKEAGGRFWTRIGAAWTHADGNGFNIQIETLPLDGRITLRIASEKSE